MKRLLKWGLLTFVAILFILGVIGYFAGGDSKQEQTANSVATSNSTPVIEQSPVPTKKTITYEIVQRWEINNGGRGMAILISKDLVNEADMTMLGQKLKEDLKKDKNNFVMVFTNKAATELRDKVASGTLTKTEEEIYDTNYVGQYTKNGNSGLHTFVIYFDGVSGKNSKTIKY